METFNLTKVSKVFMWVKRPFLDKVASLPIIFLLESCFPCRILWIDTSRTSPAFSA
jgi:hypothetical protein